jgi:uncharacterized protein YecT (DUF1311 family)
MRAKLVVLIFLILFSQTGFAKYVCKKDLSYVSNDNECAYNMYLDSDKTLNETYQKLLHKYRNYPAALHNSIVAERLWVKFLNAEIEMEYPPLKDGHFYGAMQFVMKYGSLKELTDERTKQLNAILTDNYVDELNE